MAYPTALDTSGTLPNPTGTSTQASLKRVYINIQDRPLSKKLILTSCIICEKQYKVYISELAIGKGKYCSKECSMNRPRQHKTRITTCGYCKKTFEMWECRLDKGWYKYCDRFCAAKAALGKTPWNKGLKSEQRGENHYNWQGGKTPKSLRIRHSFEYKQWRKAIFERDNYTCQHCGDKRGGNLQADHIKPFAYFPELRFIMNNGRTLCSDCHKKTDTYLQGATKLYGKVMA